MSLAIDVSKVVAVLLADGWHNVKDMEIDTYEFVDSWSQGEQLDPPEIRLGGAEEPLIAARGARWLEKAGGDSYYAYCPLNAIYAVRVYIRQQE